MSADDLGLKWAAGELPNWRISPPELEGGLFSAHSPTWAVDGLQIQALTPTELVARVRVQERLVAIVAGRGTLPPGGVVAGQDLRAPARNLATSAALAPQERAAPPPLPLPAPKPPKALSSVLDFGTARSLGYEGDACPECHAMTMVRNGSCLKCQSCGATTGCS